MYTAMRFVSTLLLLLVLANRTFAAVFVFTPDAVAAVPITNTSTAAVTGQLVDGGLAASANQAWAGKIVLVDRGVTSVLDKINAVKAGGGIAMIFVNNVAGPFTATLGTGNSSTLTGVLVTLENGAAIKAKVGSVIAIGPTAPVVIPTPGPEIPDPTGHSTELLGSDGTKLTYIKMVPTRSQLLTAVTVREGQTITLSVDTDGSPPFTYQWMLDGSIMVGATQSAYFIESTTESDSGRYMCTVTNSAGSATSQVFTLTVKPNPIP
jgi:PA domain-containing protein/Ig-like domain-containing protein